MGVPREAVVGALAALDALLVVDVIPAACVAPVASGDVVLATSSALAVNMWEIGRVRRTSVWCCVLHLKCLEPFQLVDVSQ